MVNVKRSMVPSLLAQHKGKFFSCTFVKKDGSERSLNCRIGAIKGHDGINPIAHLTEYVTVTTHEGGKMEFKNVNVNTMSNLSIAGAQYNIVD